VIIGIIKIIIKSVYYFNVLSVSGLYIWLSMEAR